jgi:cell division septum initiation protein DivIVA
MTKKLIKDLQTVNKELKALVKKTESLLKAVDKLEKPKAKPTKATAVKKPPAKKAAVKKAASATAADTVLAIINRSKKGVGTAALMEKTGYNKKKIFNLVFKLKKLGKIKSVDKGIYLKA